ncbi:hypothetical protein [Lacticaseibacillus daqingensis]|uniref:hypothetical protein n=1 Tax=Lacticaseibacillus daqingensis TaxID=2486014 RepID=UPI000F798D70|nr:hypothetical protein [Lacticaseibacillus daqingensis]
MMRRFRAWRQRLAQALVTLRPLILVVGGLDAIYQAAIRRDGFLTQLYGLQWPLRSVWPALDSLLWLALSLVVAARVATALTVAPSAPWLAAASQLAMAINLRGETVVLATSGPLRVFMAIVLATGWAAFSRLPVARAHAWSLGAGGVFGAFGLAQGLSQLRFWWQLAVPNAWWAWLSGGLTWLGGAIISQPTADPNAATNLAYALSHQNLSGVPRPVTFSTVFLPLAAMGGGGALLALVVVLLLKRRRVAWGLLLPTVVNLPTTALLAVPAMLNPWLLAPMLGVPLMIQAWYAIALWGHLMPPAVFPVPATTPPLLGAWLATNGDWRTLGVALVALGLAVAGYWPFVTRALKEARDNEMA